MIRFAAFVAVAALTASAANASEVHVSTVGKTPTQIRAELKVAIHAVCTKDASGQFLPGGEYASCVKQNLKAAVALVPQDRQFAAR